MNQLTLFSNPTKPARARIARNSDPSTSHQSAKEAAKQLGILQAACLVALDGFSYPLTANEIAAECGRMRPAVRQASRIVPQATARTCRSQRSC